MLFLCNSTGTAITRRATKNILSFTKLRDYYGWRWIVQSGLKVQKEKLMPVVYKEIKHHNECRIDMLVENKVVIEIKTVEALNCWRNFESKQFFKTHRLFERLF